MASYGTSLPDSVRLVDTRSSSHLALLPALSSFLSTLCTTQRDTASKLSAQVGSFRRHVAQSAPERSNGAILGQGQQGASLEDALGRVLEQVDLQVREQGDGAERVMREVAQRSEEVGNRLEGVRKKHFAFYHKLLASRDAAFSARDRSRSAYFSACESLESARQKKASSAGAGDKGADKAARAYDAAMGEMEVAKDQYLLDLSAANGAQARLYGERLPELHDEYQALEASGVRQLTGLLERMVQLQRESGERVLASVEAARQALETVEVERDQEAFVARYEPTVLGAFEVPAEQAFEESPVWHDTDAFALSPTCVTYLQNVQLRSDAEVDKVAPEIEAKTREVNGLKGLRESYERQPGLGDTVGVVENLFSTSHALSTLLLTHSHHASQSLLIASTLSAAGAESTGLRPHAFRPSSFVTPATCAVCDGSVWGKGVRCEKCGMAAHGKCELKVPAGCSARPGAGVVRAKSKKTAPPVSGGGGGGASLSPTPSTSSASSSFTSLSTSTLPPPRRTVPPPGGALPPMPSAQDAGLKRGKMLYAYEAQGAGEVSVQENDPVLLLEPEDASGWLKIRVENSGAEGLVPASYVEVGDGDAGAAGGGGGGTATGGGGTGQRVVALYDYAPQAPDELGLQEGEEAELTATGMGAGEGWTEITKNGQIGIVPSSYIQLL
ncbi:hypothetical protein JCM10207_005478 [Rhodosporidiobolus poonsookiae]